MHVSLLFPASAVLFASFISSASALPRNGIVARQQLCTEDDYFNIFASDLPSYQVTPLCSNVLGITNTDVTARTVTEATIIYSTTVIVGTTTDTVTTYLSTSTFTTTSTAYNIKKRDEAPPMITARAELEDMVGEKLKARQNTNLDLSAISSGIVSACSCLDIQPEPNWVTATEIITTSEPVRDNAYVTINITATAAAATIVTEVVTFTANILSTSSTSMTVVSSSTLSSTTSASKLTRPNHHDAPSEPWKAPYTSTSSSDTSSTSSTPTSSSSSSSTGAGPVSTSTTSSSITSRSTSSSSTSSFTSASSSVGPVTTGCPSINGTYFNTSDPCQYYQVTCGVSYPPGDFYDLEESYPSLEICAAYVCTPANTGMTTPCLGVVWNSLNGNCQELKSTDNSTNDTLSIAAIGMRSTDPSCQQNNITNTTTTSSTSSTTIPYPASNTSTWAYPTGTGTSWSHHSHNHTYAGNTTWPTMNSTRDHWMPTGTGWSIGTVPSGGPTQTANSTCPVTTITSVDTVYGTIIGPTTTITIGVNITETVTFTSTLTGAHHAGQPGARGW